MINKLLIANRGEIACRIIKSCRELGIGSVAVYSDADADARHVAMADEAVRLGPAPVSESYLRTDAILDAAKLTGADAVHPGYGFLSENPEFVEAVEAAGLIFVGPSASAIRAMGLKDQAKTLMEEAGVPVVPGYHGAEQDPEFLAQKAAEIGYPVLIKARAGGGGKGMRLVEAPGDFADALVSAAREGKASFGDPHCLIEKYIQSPRHIEVQVFGDAHGNVVHLFERDCSLQRRHQKVIEEAPAPGMTDELRAAMGAAAVAAAKAVDYASAGTVEFIVDGAAFPDPKAFWFMEMNTRLQVEHPVTEAVTGLDLVALQLSVAGGEPLPFTQDEVTVRGHAFEARLYAEDPANAFLPATGQLNRLWFGADARIDTGVGEGDVITQHYDPMIAKVITHGEDRATALRLLARALEDTKVAGVQTNRDFLIRLARDEDFQAGDVDTGLIARKGAELVADLPATTLDWAAAALCVLRVPAGLGLVGLANFRHFGAARQIVRFEEAQVTVETLGGQVRLETPDGELNVSAVDWVGDALSFIVDDRRVRFHVLADEQSVSVERQGSTRGFALLQSGSNADAGSGDVVLAPLTGRVVSVMAKAGDVVAKGDALLVLEAMKMEHRLVAPRDGTIAEVNTGEGEQVDQGAALVKLAEVEP
ncbi:acetyl/propionyl/methylcrotonyl-CoA carboxylase subunit alpha [Rhodobacteraceae bacterium]|nr:acetyl/propionyl/methylcrotonyl-CoA carboxylase subunit alpha [Paracoccaceae bacterium]